VSVEATMRVPGIPLRPIFNHKPIKVKMTEARLGLWQVSKEQEVWADELVTQLVNMRENKSAPLTTPEVLPKFSEHMEWVRDDTHIVRDVINLTQGKPPGSMLLITKDYRLCRKIARTTNQTIVAMSPESVIINNKRSRWDEEASKEVSRTLLNVYRQHIEAFAPKVYDVIVDVGSFKAHAEHMELGTNAHGEETGCIYRADLREADFTTSGRRSLVEYTLLNNVNKYPVRVFSPHNEFRTTVLPPDPVAAPRPKMRYTALRNRFTWKKG
jgi:hypothetical protein